MFIQTRTRLFIRLGMAMVVAIAACISLLAGAAQAGASTGEQGTSGDIYQLLSEGKLGEALGADSEGDKSGQYDTPEQPTVYLTFDDGPSKWTPKVLDILAKENIKATFFELGNEAETHPETVKRIIAEGHSIGNHSYDHVYGTLYGGFANFWKEAVRTENIFDEIAGIKPALMRAPGGTVDNFDAFYFYLLKKAGYTIVDWNIDSGDSSRAGVPAEEIVSTVKNGPFPHEAIVLMHDGSGHGETVKALPEIISIFKDKGYRFAALGGKVKPVQFSLHNSRWKRSLSEDEFAELENEAEAHGEQVTAEWNAKPAEAGSPGFGESEEEAPAVPAGDRETVQKETIPTVGLNVAINGVSWELAGPEYRFSYGRFIVPLREMAERMGAKVEWREETETAVVRYGWRTVEYDLRQGVIRTSAPGEKPEVHYLADMKRIDGRLFVPIRQTAEILGGKVTGYSIGDQERQVELDMNGGFPPIRELLSMKPFFAA